MSAITTHVLDTAKGCPAKGIEVCLEILASGEKWQTLGKGVTNADGRVLDLLAKGQVLAAGTYRLTFAAEAYFKKQSIRGFYGQIPIVFCVERDQVDKHYHVPLLLSPFGYSTYRGS